MVRPFCTCIVLPVQVWDGWLPRVIGALLLENWEDWG